jgi:uncharacterized protein involved in exopolysaccharide biosynthesis
VLDKAVPAEKKTKPQRVLIVFFTTFFALTFSILLVFVMHGIKKLDKDISSLTRKIQEWVNKIAFFYKIKV